MKKFLMSMVSEAEGEVSATRVMAVGCFLTGVCIGVFGVVVGKDLSGLAQVCGVFVGSAFAGKVAQKFGE